MRDRAHLSTSAFSAQCAARTAQVQLELFLEDVNRMDKDSRYSFAYDADSCNYCIFDNEAKVNVATTLHRRMAIVITDVFNCIYHNRIEKPK